ncbi:alpha-amylase [Flavilitoribacter nigricans DSM 23189 = NBRC 102662]|uniref:Alpha-amylase n=1 Tax=Flavilitoribacter nigricans (strain ATCC 23147 / DSM 23189 / NBRC 102662 / NCIMB 1420 / SS-2) TaxID=1122177 RepID=A0A2D0NED5_FLAN2|nr:alpha-amylase [Flavilitoribacter nigricans DSM 23189 = NBRC 102662]
MSRNLWCLLLIAGLLASCGEGPDTTETNDDDQNLQPAATATDATFPEKIAAGTIYEVNIRQHTPEGTINAFAEDLPRLQEMGIKMLWIMPVQTIGTKNRKGSLGSYYSIRDYREVNPEFGNLDDFKSLVDKAHELGMYVILDWVPNHTAWDHPWITEHKDYYAQNEAGEVIYEADWTDIALLDHTNPATRAAMIDDMKYWVTEADIDGFRCDHAGHEIPLYFWEEATSVIDPLKDLFWLAEWDGARMHLEFDATYAWELLHLTEDVAKGEHNADDLDEWIRKDLQEYGQAPIRLTMITNHDENSWAGTLNERYGESQKAFATFVFTAYGVPMLYSGQEAGLDKRLRFFEKDTIDWSDPNQLQPFYTQLVQFRLDNEAVWGGLYGGMPVRINDNANVYAFKREKNGNTVIGILNFSATSQSADLTDSSINGTYTDYFTGEEYTLESDGSLELGPWEYLLFAR